MKRVAAAVSTETIDNLMSRARDRRRTQRVKVTLLGRYMLEDRREFPCQTIDVSPGGVALFAPVRPTIGSRIIAYLDEIGRIEGVAVRPLDTGFAAALTGTATKREKLADQLTWLANRQALGLPEDRRHERVQPINPRSTLILSDGREYLIKLVDVSLSGAGMKTDARPPLGSLVTVGKTQGRVVREVEGGIAVEFIRSFDPASFDESVKL